MHTVGTIRIIRRCILGENNKGLGGLGVTVFFSFCELSSQHVKHYPKEPLKHQGLIKTSAVFNDSFYTLQRTWSLLRLNPIKRPGAAICAVSL